MGGDLSTNMLALSGGVGRRYFQLNNLRHLTVM